MSYLINHVCFTHSRDGFVGITLPTYGWNNISIVVASEYVPPD